MAYRDDISDYLIHFVSADTDDDAFVTLIAILDEGRLLGSGNLIKGKYRCVCFTEAPLDKIGPTVAEAALHGLRYKPFGVIVKKNWLFDLGGRPVIYGPPSDFDELPASQKWRHMRYEPTSTPRVDFTWEREWRLRTDALAIDPVAADVVVPSEWHARQLVGLHDAWQDSEVESIRQTMDDDDYYTAEQYREAFPWDFWLIRKP